MERRRRLRNVFAITTAELLPHRLNHFPLARLRFQGSRHVFAEFAQAIAATALTRRGRIDHHALAGQVIGERVALGPRTRKSAHGRCLRNRCLGRKLIFRGACVQLFKGQRQLINQPRRTLRSLPVNLSLQLGDPQLLLGDQCHVFGRPGPRDHQYRSHLEGPGTFDEQRVFQRIDVIRHSVTISVHTTRESQIL
jgi:hypothetical protein